MTFGVNLKEARKEAGLSQEQLAEKICVSRSAIAKWETDKGMPDINNLKVIAQLLDVSIDYLLDDDERVSFNKITESINLDDYVVTGKCRNKYDAVCVAKHSGADSIYALFRTRKMSKLEWCIDFIVSPGIVDVLDQVNDMATYYLAEKGTKQYLVKVTKDFITTDELADKVDVKKFIVGKNKFKKGYQIL